MKRLKPNFLLCVVALLFGTSPAARLAHGAQGISLNERKLATFENAPPIPAPVKLTLTSRSPVRVILRVKGLQKEPVTFYLREDPEHGTARILPQVSREWAELEYTPTQDRRFTTDSFKFVVSNSSGTSSESTAEVTIKDIGPRLEMPHHLDFGLLQTGESKEMPLTIRNTGDITADGTISVTGDWFLSKGPPRYYLDPGQSMVVTLGLAPKRSGILEGEMQFSSGSSRSLFLMAKVEDWVHARPDPLLLKTQGQQKRAATLLLGNETELRQQIRIESEPPLSHPYFVWIAPKQTIAVPLVCTDSTPLEQNGKLILHGSDGRRRIMLWRAAAFGPSLGGLDPGKTLVLLPGANHRLEKKLEVWNQGGRGGRWELRASDPYKFHLPNQAETNKGMVDLAPGESTELFVTLPGKMPARFDGVLEARLIRPASSLEHPPHALTLTTRKSAVVESSEDKPLPTNPPNSTPKKSSPLPDAPAYPELVLPDSDTKPPQLLDGSVVKTIMDMTRPGAENGIGVSQITANSVRLTVSAPANIPLQAFEISSGVATDTPSGLEFVWKPLKKVKVKAVSGGTLVLDIGGLTPDSPNNIRITTLPNGGALPPFYRQCYFITSPEPHWLSPGRPYLWVVAVLLALTAYQRMQPRRFRF